jgi:hypothetical protein
MNFMFWSNDFKEFYLIQFYLNFFKLAKLMMDAWYVFNSISEICGHFQSIHWTMEFSIISHISLRFFCWLCESRWIPIVNYRSVRINSPCTSTSLSWLYNTIVWILSNPHLDALNIVLMFSVWLSRKFANNVCDILLVEENILH